MALPNLGFPSQARLIKTDDFSSVFSFRKRISGHFLALHYQYNQLGRPRLGLVVSKKIARLSVSRNYMRRVLREVFRHQQQNFASVDVVVRVQRLFSKADHAQLKQEFLELLDRLNRRANADKAEQ